jgi:hypothetical protein
MRRGANANAAPKSATAMKSLLIGQRFRIRIKPAIVPTNELINSLDGTKYSILTPLLARGHSTDPSGNL